MANQPPATKTAITPRREDDFPEWYQQVIRAAELAEPSEVRGCMVIRPWGYGIWENMQRQLDAMFKATGHRNAYFPLFIPLSYLAREAEHVEGFAKECAVVTHHRLKFDKIQGLMPDPASELTEPLVVRPTSETIIGASYAKWVQSYRDLPILINQWANVVRWEMRPRIFLRTTEFLWQEGHTAHETEPEARAETQQMLDVYETFVRDHLAIPVFSGEKSESERFPGAVQTLCIEAMVQDRKAIQAGTSHFLGQNFARASGIEFHSRIGTQEYAWTTSWGMSTRMIGAVIMTHGDDDGLILPPRIAPAHVVILPVINKPEGRETVLERTKQLADEIRAQTYSDEKVRVELDLRDMAGGQKKWDWIKKGIPIRIEVGWRDLQNDVGVCFRRDTVGREIRKLGDLVGAIPTILNSIQQNLLERAKQFRDTHTREIDSKEEFYAFFTARNSAKPEIHGGFALTHWDGSRAVEEQIKNDLKVTIRCIPFDDPTNPPEPGTYPFTGNPSPRRVIWAKAY